MSCPNVSTTWDPILCNIFVSSGSDLQVNIDYGDGSQETFKSLDSELLKYGIPVPQNLIQLTSLSPVPGQVFIIANSEFEFDGYLRGFELYATAEGSIDFFVSLYK